MNNEPDYDNLYFEEKKMTWKELVKKAKEMGWEHKKTDYSEYLLSWEIEDTSIKFYSDGEIVVDNSTFSQYRTPDQMYQIMLALR